MVDHINANLFQVSVKGLYFDRENKIMMLLDPEGYWEPFGGRVQKGENLVECLIRECKEETGLDCKVPDKRPFVAYSTIDQNRKARIMIYYKVELESLDFTTTDECVDIKFFSKEEIKSLKVVPQIKLLPDYL